MLANIAAYAAMMNRELPKEKRNIKVADAIRILKENGREISDKEAENVLETMHFLAKLIVNQNFKK